MANRLWITVEVDIDNNLARAANQVLEPSGDDLLLRILLQQKLNIPEKKKKATADQETGTKKRNAPESKATSNSKRQDSKAKGSWPVLSSLIEPN